ncbi:hypothetical protein BKA93DRAFT_749214 [Sparassis latifolia]
MARERPIQNEVLPQHSEDREASGYTRYVLGQKAAREQNRSTSAASGGAKKNQVACHDCNDAPADYPNTAGSRCARFATSRLAAMHLQTTKVLPGSAHWRASQPRTRAGRHAATDTAGIDRMLVRAPIAQCQEVANDCAAKWVPAQAGALAKATAVWWITCRKRRAEKLAAAAWWSCRSPQRRSRVKARLRLWCDGRSDGPQPRRSNGLGLEA